MSVGTVDQQPQQQENKSRTKLVHLPLSLIRPNKQILRKVKTDSAQYHELVDSVRQYGILNAIVVREAHDDELGKKIYYVIEGLHRYNAAISAGLDEIPCQVRRMNDSDVLSAQIVGNIHRVETRPAEYAGNIERLLLNNPMMTVADAAARFNKSPGWVCKTLRLTQLPDHVQKMVDDKTIKVYNAYALVDLNAVAPEEVNNFLEQAQTLPTEQFSTMVDQRVRAIKNARTQGRDPNKVDEFVAHPFVRLATELKAEFSKPEVAPRVLKEMNATTPEAGFAAAIAWSLHMDPAAVEEARIHYEKLKDQRKAEKEKRKAEREKQQNDAAIAKAADATM